MGDGTRTRARWAALATGMALILAGLFAPQAAVAAETPEESRAALYAAIASYVSNKKGSYSVTVTELDGDQRTVAYRGGKQVEPASTIKLFYAWAALRAVDEGKLRLSTRLSSGATVGGCIRVMIEVSDNACSVDLRVKLGARTLNRLFASEGFPNTRIVLDRKGRYVTKRTSTNDLARLLSRLERGELLSPAMTITFKNSLLAQIWRHRIGSGVPPGIVVGSKSGQLWVRSGMVEADTAIVHGPQSRYVITAIGTNGASAAVIRGISTIVYRHFQGPVATTASYPAQQFAMKTDFALRKTPNGSRITTLRTGTVVQVLSSVRGWMRVKAGSRVGWVTFSSLTLRSAYVWPAPDPVEPPVESAPVSPSTPAPESSVPPTPAPETTPPPVPAPDATPTPDPAPPSIPEPAPSATDPPPPPTG